jgi:hypothetical protein
MYPAHPAQRAMSSVRKSWEEEEVIEAGFGKRGWTTAVNGIQHARCNSAAK